MADTKRHFSDFLEGSESPSETTIIDGKRVHKGAGRKPTDSLPKSKRTAQNRAAQRAYRERKEKRMKDLEDKVQSLEDETNKANSESDFLRAQVNMLKNELLKYRGNNDFLDLELNLPTSVGKLSNPNTKGHVPNFDKSNHQVRSSDSSDFSDLRSNSNSSVDYSPDTELSSNDNVKGGDGSINRIPLNSNNSSNQIPDLVSGSSSSTSPLNDNIINSPNERGKFEEQSDPFCSTLNEACGTKQSPIPKDKRGQKEFDYYNAKSPFSNLFNSPNYLNENGENGGNGDYNNTDFFNDDFFNNDQSGFNFNLSKKNENNDPLSFLNDNNFDVNLAFNENDDSKLDNLVNEESAYDPLKDQTNTTDFNVNDFLKSSEPFQHDQYKVQETTNSNNNNDDDDDDVVPAPDKTYKCSEIWDRITSHPRYTDIDIDGLCSELKVKAKCSERGVVINASDVTSLIEKSANSKKN